MRKFWTAALLAAFCSAEGCVAPPPVLHPGTEQQQQARAQRFDPYPENDVGPAVVGGRPQEYANPSAEILRVQPRLDEPVLVPVSPAAP
jgi:hypothetical protein